MATRRYRLSAPSSSGSGGKALAPTCLLQLAACPCTLSLNRLVVIRYGFNCGSTLALAGGADGINAGGGKLAGKVAMTTTLSAASSAITTTIICAVVEQQYDLTMALNGVLAGLVGITANCAIVDPWCAFSKIMSKHF